MKKCKVLSYNPHRQVLVFEYDNKKIQAHFHMDEVLEYMQLMLKMDCMKFRQRIL